MAQLPSRSPRRFSPAEVDEVFRRAGEVEPVAREGELTLAELEAIGAEAGLDPVAVRRAAASLAVPGAAVKHSAVAGGPTHLQLELTFPAPLTPELRARALDALRRVTGTHGTAQEVPAIGGPTPGLSWLAARGASTLRVTLTPQGDVTTARVAQSLGEHALGAHLGMLTGGGIVGTVAAIGTWFATAAAEPAALAAGAAVVASYFGARRLVARRGRAAQREVAALVAALAEALGPPNDAR
jgi:hypothetical protein